MGGTPVRGFGLLDAQRAEPIRKMCMLSGNAGWWACVAPPPGGRGATRMAAGVADRVHRDAGQAETSALDRASRMASVTSSVFAVPPMSRVR